MDNQKLNQPEPTVYSYEEAFKKSVEYFEGDELAAKVFLDANILKNKKGELLELTPDDMHRRMAKEFARIEKSKFKTPMSFDEIYQLFYKFKYLIPQSSPMFGIGNPYQITSLSNCFLGNSPKDSYGSIMRTDEQIVQISKRRGGIGVNVSNLRPSGYPTKNSSKFSTGVVSFCKRFSNSINEVGQDGRRGALMLLIDIKHPESVILAPKEDYDNPKQIILKGDKSKGERDIHTDSRYYNPDKLDFVSMKLDRKQVTGANVSVAIEDVFMDAVISNKNFEQSFIFNGENRKNLINAKKAWEKIIHLAWQSAEPGILFWDRITKYNAIDCYPEFKTEGTNPCLPARATVLTKNGISTIGEIKVGDQIWSETGWTNVINKWSTGFKKVFEYKTTFGTFEGTENHRILEDKQKIEVGNAESIDLLRGSTPINVTLNPEIIMDGLVLGDGGVHKASGNLVILYIGANDFDYFNSEIKDLIVRSREGISDECFEIKTSIKAEELPHTYLRDIPDRFFKGDNNTVCSFLRGLFSANGSISGGRVTLKASSYKVIQKVQLMLNSIGIASYITTNKAKNVKFSNGEYLCKQSYDLNITRDKDKFASLIGFIQEYKMESLSSLTKKTNVRIEQISKDIFEKNFLGEEEVFDITVDNQSHTFWNAGFNVSNCGEIPLNPLDSCRLQVLNLLTFVKNPYTNEAYFDFELLSQVTAKGMRLMDDLVDLEAEKVDSIIAKIESDPEDPADKNAELELWKKIKETCLKGRRTGFGTTALADTLAALGIRYDSEKALEIADKIFKTFKLAAFRESCEMSKEIGPFPIWNWDIEKNSEFLLQIQKEDAKLYEDISKYGRRNIGCLTLAPTGTPSIFAQTSSSGEPVFSLSHIRRKKINPTDSGSRVDFVDNMGDKWQHFTVHHKPLQKWLEINQSKTIDDSPWYKCCASDINWTQRVKLQATIQKHIDHSISSTVNLPATATEKDVATIYETAWKSGCKGITVYRDGCRSGVLISESTKNDAKNTIPKTTAPKRPESLNGEIYTLTYKGKNLYVAVGLWEDGSLYEIFTGVNLRKKIEHHTGKIVKKSRGKYFFIAPDGEEYHLTNGNNDDNADALARTISWGLRHGAGIEFAVHQLEKTEGDLLSFSKVIARVLKKYIKNGTQVHGEHCPQCKSQLVRENGCKTCKSCGYSACG